MSERLSGKESDAVIKEAQMSDAAAIDAVAKEGWLATYPNEQLGITREDILKMNWGSPDRIQRWKNRIGSGWNKIFVLQKEGRVIGFCYAEEGERENYLRALYIHPKHHGSGHGIALMKHALAWLGRKRPVRLWVAAYRPNTIRFYEQFGFEDQGVDEDPESGHLPGGMVIPQRTMRLRREEEATKKQS